MKRTYWLEIIGQKGSQRARQFQKTAGVSFESWGWTSRRYFRGIHAIAKSWGANTQCRDGIVARTNHRRRRHQMTNKIKKNSQNFYYKTAQFFGLTYERIFVVYVVYRSAGD